MVATALATLALASQVQVNNVGIAKPPVVYWGPHSKVTLPAQYLVGNERDWVHVWEKHTKKKIGENPYYRPNMLQVDFTSYMVLAIFRGQSANSDGVSFVSVDNSGDVLLVRLRDRWYQTMEEGDKVTPYGFIVLPRVSRKVVVEEDVQNRIGGPPIWKKLVTFPPI
jgi:hypothetical protein